MSEVSNQGKKKRRPPKAKDSSRDQRLDRTLEEFVGVPDFGNASLRHRLRNLAVVSAARP